MRLLIIMLNTYPILIIIANLNIHLMIITIIATTIIIINMKTDQASN